MPIVFHTQANFTAGELGEILHARIGFEGYEKAAAKLRNVLVIPQGGLRRRFGLRFTATISQTNNADETKIVILEFNISPQYLMIFTPLLVRIFIILDDNSTREITQVTTPYKAEDIKDLKFTQDSNVLLIFHENHIPALLRRTPFVSGGWNAATNVPLLASGVNPRGIGNPLASLYEVTTAGNTILDGNGDWLVGQGAFFPGGAGVWSQLLIPLDVTTPWELVDAVFQYFPTFDFDQAYEGGIFTISAVNGVNRTLSIGFTAFEFTAKFVGGLFFGNGGVMRLISLTDSKNMVGNIIQDFSGDGLIPPSPIPIFGKDALLTEPAFSNTLGWPKSGTFFQGRLWFGGSKALPAGIFGSVINDFFNFDGSQGVDSGAIFVFIQSTKANIVRFVIGTQSLIVFTTDGEFSTQVILENAVTPSNISLIQQSKNGSSDVEPIAIDDQVVFVDRSGKIVRTMIYDSQHGAYSADNISILSSQLIENPVSSAVYKGNTADDSTYLFLVNQKEGSEIDGTVAAYQTLQSQSVSAWTLLTTDGKFKQTTGSSNNAFFVVERLGKLYVEQLDFDLLLDAAVVSVNDPPTNLITGLDHLNGQSVRVIADGVIIEPLLTVTSNVLQLPFAAKNVTVGLDFKPLIQTLPISMNTQTGPNFYLPKHIKRVFVDFFESLGIEVDGIPLKDLKFSVNNFDVPTPPRTGFDSLMISKGHESKQQIVTITQSLPLPMTIRAIGVEVDIHE